MSRFFAAGDSSSESSSGEEELYSDEEEERPAGQAEESSEEESEDTEDGGEDESSSEEGGPVGVSRFLRDAASSDDESDESDTGPKVVKSAKSKRLEEMEGVIKLIDNAIKINDWSSISNEFDKLNRQVTKVAQADNRPPKLFVKTIADLEDFMNEAIAKQKVTPKKMNATNAKGLNAMKQKIKKTNKEYATEIEKYREDKGDYMMSDEEEEAPQPDKKKKGAAAPVVDEGAVDDDQGFSTVGQGGRTLRYTPESILSHLRTINEARGKKNTDRQSQVHIMERLLSVAVTPYHKIRVLLSLVSTRFDITSGSTSSYMTQEQWRA